jgi:hypothetical protein
MLFCNELFAQGARLQPNSTLTYKYKLGTDYQLKVAAGDGLVNIYFQYEGMGSLDIPAFSLDSTCAQIGYYKAGMCCDLECCYL